MAINPWPVGTDAPSKARSQLRAFIKSWLANPKYKPRLPRQHLTILDEGKKESAGIIIRVASGPDEKGPWPYKSANGHQAVTDTHRIAVIVKADQKAGGADSVSAVHGALRALFTARYETPERTALEATGIQNCMEMPDGIDLSPDDEDEEGTFYKQVMACQTEMQATQNGRG